VAPTCLASLEISFLGPVMREVPAERRKGGREGMSVSENRDPTCLASLKISFLWPVMRDVPAERREGGREGG